jgi:hypothetical protein
MREADYTGDAQVLRDAHDAMMKAAWAFQPRALTAEERVDLQERLIGSALKLNSMAERFANGAE